MESKRDIYYLWVQYTTKNEEEFFWQFVKGFVTIWESQLRLDWSRLPDCLTVKHDSGPHLSRLPEELLPAIGKFMYLVKEETEKKSVSPKSLKKVELLVRCLIVICRNFDNIPLIASCDFVNQSVGITATIVNQLVEDNADFGEAGASFFIHFCHLLECLYDPYFTWRHFLAGNLADIERLSLQPALLHVEVVPFIYDCFQTSLIEEFPDLSTELVHVLGAIISGAQSMILKFEPLGLDDRRKSLDNSTHCLNEGHNALRAICPATVNIVMGIVSHAKANTDVRHTAIHCFVMMVQLLNRCSPDQRQIEVGTIIQLYQDSLIELITNEWHEKSSQMMCEVVAALRSLLTGSGMQEQMQRVMVDNHLLDTVITIIEESARFSFEKQLLATECVKTMTLMLIGSSIGKEKLAQSTGYERLFSVLRSIGPPSKELLNALLAMAAEEERSQWSRLKNADVLLMMVRWLGDIDAEAQQWLAGVVYQLSTSSLPSKSLACQHGVILGVCQALEHPKLSQKAANELIKLLELLASHSITSYELKEIFLLLREDADFQFPYRIQLLHALSSVARKGDYVDCTSYFDIQQDWEGISVPSIKKWSGVGYGFSFHCWVRLDSIEEPQLVSPTNYRRQLFNLQTSSGAGLEAFFRTDGALVVGISTKKEFLSASVTDFPLLDGQWHCVDICHMTARRPFGQNQLTVYIDGTQRLGAGVKSSAMTDPFTVCTVGSVVRRRSSSSNATMDGKSGDRGGLLPGGMMDRGLLPSLMNQVPNYFTLPLRTSAPLDPNIKSLPAGMQDTIWGTPTSLRGQVGLVCLFHEALAPQQVKTLYDAGPSCFALFAPEDVPEFVELTSKLVFCFSPMAYSNNICLDLAPTSKYDGHVVAAHCQTHSIKNVINGIGGVHALFPILENASKSDEGPDLSFLSPSVEKECRLIEGHEGSVDSDEWEILPSSSYSDWKLEQNPVSGFLSLLKNVIAASPLNQEQLMKNNGLLIIGVLLAKAKPHLIDVNVLMAVQLLVEMARDVPNMMLQQSLFQHILFNFRIWSRSQFHIRIGHVQYISTVIKDDRRYFRKKYGVQFLLDVIRQYYAACELLSSEDSKTIRVSLLSLVKYYMQKELNAKEVAAILGFLSSVKEEVLLLEVLEMLVSYMENKNSKDQIFLLLYEPDRAEILYCLLVDRSFSMELKQKVLKLFSVLLQSDRIYERHKCRLRLQDGSVLGGSSVCMYPGLIALLQDQQLSVEFTEMLLDQILSTDNSGAYAGALSLLHALSLASLDLKLKAARKVLTSMYLKTNAPQQFAKQVGWQDCITRLLVKRPISTTKLQPSDSLPDLMSFDEENLELEDASYSPSSVSRLSTHVTDAALVIENELKEVAESVTNAVADNIHYAADNITSVVASAYSVFRQKTFEMQESLEELGESAVSRLKRRSLISLYDAPSDRECSPSPSHASPRPVRTPQSLTSLGLDLDNVSLGNRSGSSTSTEDLSSPIQNDNTASNKDDVSIASVQSISGNTSNDNEEEERLMNVGLKHWHEMDAEKLVDQEEELCCRVVNILFMILWRGVEGASKEAWKERGEVMACINLLGLNNELCCSHLQLKLQILEMGVEASLLDLRDVGQTMALSTHAENAAQLMRWIYDLVVLDPNEDTSKKASTKLLDGVLGLLDALLVFHEGPGEEWTEMAKLAFGILLSCSANSNLELCAMATAKLHALIQTRNMKDPEEGAYLLYLMNRIVQKAIKADNQEHYSFVIPVLKALLEKLTVTLALANHLPGLPQTQAGPAFFDDFQFYCQEAEWKLFMEKKVRSLHDAYQAGLSAQLTEAMNVFWAECYEGSKTAVHRRNREVGDSKLRFQSQIVTPFRQRQTEDSARFSNLVNQQRNQELLVRRKWRNLKQFFVGPRGAWQSRSPVSRHWKLSHHENFSRMRLKLCPSLTFDPHTDASNLRDNTGWLSRMQSAEEMPLSFSVSSAAVRGEIEEDSLPEEELRVMSEAECDGREMPEKEKLVLKQECELVTLMTVVRGQLELTTSHFYFYDLSPVKEDVERQDFKWALSRLREVHLRRYNLRRSALEFFLTDQTNYFLNFSTKTRNKVYSRILNLRPPNLCHYSSRSPAELLRSTGLTQKWVNREISNFDYLMQLNTLAGRTYNDLSQYPVFPWILADYTSEELDLTNPSTFRDLSKPIGVVNPKNVPEVKAKYDSFEDPSGTIAKFHYGTHYSNSAGVLHYLVRVEPFTSLHIELQSGRFDVADRQFHSIPQTWKLLMDNPNDVKELTPEFFYFTEFLKNMNGFDLGLLQGTKERVNDVILPKWASSPEDFIYQHRKALECEHVSQHLHEWIDLIFGYKQKGPKAVEALNVFYYCSYEGAVDLDAITNPVEREAVEGMINNFGQTPSQLLKEPHPQRLSLDDAIAKMLKSELRKADFTLFLDNLRPIPVEVSNEKDPIVFMSAPRSPSRSFLQVGIADTLVSVSELGVVGVHSWLPHDRHGSRGFTLDVDPTIYNAKTRRKLSGPFHPSLPLSSHLFVVSHDAKFLFSGGYWDSSLRVYSLAKSKTVASVRRHFDLVTCVALDRCGSFLVTGSRDTTCVVWDVSHLATGSSSVVHMTPRPVQTLYGHDKAVTCVGIMTDLDMAVSGSLDGTVNVHTIQEGHYVRTLEPVGCDGLRTQITFLALSSQGHVAFSATDKVSHSVHVFSVNGVNLGSKYVSGRVTGLAIAGDHLVVVDDAGDLTMSRILGLRPVYDIPLHLPIQSVVVTAGNTHLLVPTQEGKVIVLGVLSNTDLK